MTKALAQTKAPHEVKAEDYVAIYYTGGHGVVWDFPDNEELQRLVETIYQNGGYVTAVCHGVVGLLNLRLPDGAYLIKDKVVTGFTNTEEWLSGKARKVPFSTENELKKRGAIYRKKAFFRPYATVDGRIITGQNPQSPRVVAKALIKALQ